VDGGLILPPGLFVAGGGAREVNPLDPLNRGLLGRWTFADGTGRDSSVWRSHATAVNGPTQAAGRYGKAARFTGSAGTSTTNWNIGVRPGLSGLQVPYTFSARIFQTNNSGFQAIFADYRNFPLELIKTLRVDNGTLRYFCRDAGFIQSLGSLSVPTNRWVHVAVVIGGTIAAPTGLLVVDTLSEVLSMSALASSVVTDLPVRIGASEHAMIGAGNDGFDGLIQDTGFWSRALIPSELDRLRSEPFAGTSDSVTRLFFAVGRASALPPLTADSTQTLTVSGTIASALAIAGASTQTLATSGTIAGTVGLAGVSTATLAITGTAAGTLALSGASTATLAITGTAAGAVSLAATSSQTLAITGSITAVNPFAEGLPAAWLPQTAASTRNVAPQAVATLRAPTASNRLRPTSGGPLRGSGDPS
jgi:hypothetical protein